MPTIIRETVLPGSTGGYIDRYPAGAKILSVQSNGSNIGVLFMVDPQEPNCVTRYFYIAKTRETLPEVDLNYLGTVQIHNQVLGADMVSTFHVFEEVGDVRSIDLVS